MNVRLLNPDDNNDVIQLTKILEHYKQNELTNKNPVYLTSNLLNHADWMLAQFRIQNKRDFKVTGMFNGDDLVKILIGYKIDITWGRKENSHFPYWCVGLLYFKEKVWRSPADNFQQLADFSAKEFEKEGYTKTLIVQKLPNRLLRAQSSLDFFSKDNFFRTFPVKRYIVVLENIFMTQDDIDRYEFPGIKSMLPKNILRPVMLLSHTLNLLQKDGNS